MGKRLKGFVAAAAVAVTSLGGVVALPSSSAFAAAACASGTAPPYNGSFTTGTSVRYKNGYGSIYWYFNNDPGFSCPITLPGGSSMRFSMRVRFCSGSGGVSGGHEFTTAGGHEIAVTVRNGACFQTQYKSNNSATANKSFAGVIVW